MQQIVAIVKAHPKRQSKANPWEAYQKPYVLVDGITPAQVKSYVITEAYVYGSPLTLQTVVERYRRVFCQNHSK